MQRGRHSIERTKRGATAISREGKQVSGVPLGLLSGIIDRKEEELHPPSPLSLIQREVSTDNLLLGLSALSVPFRCKGQHCASPARMGSHNPSNKSKKALEYDKDTLPRVTRFRFAIISSISLDTMRRGLLEFSRGRERFARVDLEYIRFCRWRKRFIYMLMANSFRRSRCRLIRAREEGRGIRVVSIDCYVDNWKDN